MSEPTMREIGRIGSRIANERRTPEQAREWGKLGGSRNRGENNPRAKLTRAQARAIREAHALGSVTQAELARRFGVSTSTVRRVLKGEVWREVP